VNKVRLNSYKIFLNPIPLKKIPKCNIFFLGNQHEGGADSGEEAECPHELDSPGANVIKLSSSSLTNWPSKLECFSLVVHYCQD
jgi:hypothetical protein